MDIKYNYIGFSFQRGRVSDMYFDTYTEERHNIKFTITDNPTEINLVQSGVFRQPNSVEVDIVISDVFLPIGISNNILVSLFNIKRRSQDAFDKLKRLADTMQPVDVVLGLASYKNYMIEEIIATRNEDSRGVLLATIRLKELLLVNNETDDIFKTNNREPKYKANTDKGNVNTNAPDTLKIPLSFKKYYSNLWSTDELYN